jgi:lysophospholipase L1-like esterase
MRLATHAEKIILAGIPTVDTSGPQSKLFDSATVERNDAIISEIAKYRGLSFIDLRKQTTSGKLTIDGVHLNPTGYKEWEPAILRDVADSLGCKIVAQH